MVAAQAAAWVLAVRAWAAALVERVQATAKGAGRQDAAVSWVATQPAPRPAVAMKAMTSWAKVLASSGGSLDGEAHEFWPRPVHCFDVRVQPELQDATFHHSHEGRCKPEAT